MTIFIRETDVSVRFRIYHNSNPSFKELVISLFDKKKRGKSTEFLAVNHVSLEIKPGDRLGIIGLNGAGKSTLLKTITGIYSPHQGRIEVSGRITPLIELGAGFDPEQTGQDNIFLNGALLGFPPGEMEEKNRRFWNFQNSADLLNYPSSITLVACTCVWHFPLRP